MTQLWAWKYNGQDEIGYVGIKIGGEKVAVTLKPIESWNGYVNVRKMSEVTNLHKVKVVDEDAITISKELWGWINSSDVAYENGWRIREKIISENPHLDPTPPVQEPKNYLTTEQFIKVWQSLDESKQKELNTAWYAARNTARYAAWDADLAVLVKDKISNEHFEILTRPWTSCGLSLYAEDWQEVLNPKVVEPKNFGAVVEASFKSFSDRSRQRWVSAPTYQGTLIWHSEDCAMQPWKNLINPVILSNGIPND